LLKLFLAFTVIPAVELFLLIWLGQYLGPLGTVAIVLVTGATGAWLAKREGLGLLKRLQSDLRRGIPPAERLVEGGLVVVGGVLLITPGVLTDLTGFLLVAGPTRRLLAPIALRWLASRFTVEGMGVDLGPMRPHDPERPSIVDDPDRPDKTFSHPTR
jgi:UPF0716 protein FxsA